MIGARQRLVASDPAAGKAFGGSVAIDGDTAIIGASDDSTHGQSSGAAYVFVRTGAGGSWQFLSKLVPVNLAMQDHFGDSVAISGNTLVVGATDRNLVGAVFVYRRASSALSSPWTVDQELAPTGSSPPPEFGGAVAVSGTTVLIGAPGDTTTGAAYVFVRGSGTPAWTQQGAKLLPALSPPDPPRFGTSVALDGDAAIVGAPGLTSVGGAVAFQRTGVTWDTGVNLTVPASIGAPADFDAFGNSVSISGTWALLGAPGANVNFVRSSGSAFFFEHVGTSWVARQRVDTPAPADSGGFGVVVALSSTRAAIGAPGENSEKGDIHLYSRTGSTWARTPPPLSSGASEFVGFSKALAVSTSTVLVGASQEPCTNGECTAEGATYAFGIADARDVPFLGGYGAATLLGALAVSGSAVRRLLRGRHGVSAA